MYIVLIRHGEIGSNKCANSKFNPKFKNYLSPTGIRQAKKTAEFLKNLNIKNIYSSPYGRAYQTALPYSNLSKLKIITLDWLKEFQMGYSSLTNKEWEKEVKKNSNRYMEELYKNPPGWDSTYGFWTHSTNYV